MRQRGSHVQYRHVDGRGTTVPFHKGRDIAVPLLRQTAKDIGLTPTAHTVPAGILGPITPAVEAKLNERQKRMAAILAAGEPLTSRRCEIEFGVTRDTASRDFALLLKLGIAAKVGKGRSVHYVRTSTF